MQILKATMKRSLLGISHETVHFKAKKLIISDKVNYVQCLTETVALKINL